MSNKIGLYFKNQLPASIPTGEDFSFYFIKNNIQETIYLPEGITSQVNFEFNNIFLGKKNQDNTSSFFQINKINSFYFKTINGISAKNNQGYINLTLDDVVKFGGTTNVMKINNTFLFSDTTDTTTIFLGSYKSELIGLNNSAKKDYIKNKFDKSVFIGHFGYNNLNNNQKFTNSVLLINKLFINYQTVNNSIFIGNDITVQEITDINIYENNLNIGGSFIDNIALAANVQNKIEGNIFIKNLGFGNTSNNFILLPKLNLSNIDTLNNYTTLDILFRNNNGNVSKINTNYLFKPLNDKIDTVQQNYTTLNSLINNQGNSISEINNKINSLKSIYDFDFTNKKQTISFNTQNNVENNVFSVNLDANNNDFYKNIFYVKFIQNDNSYFKFNSKIILNNAFIPKTGADPLFNSKLTFNESTGEIGYDYDNEKYFIFEKNYNSSLNKDINVRIVYNQLLVNIHIEFVSDVTLNGYEIVELPIDLTNLNYPLKSVWDMPAIKYASGFTKGEVSIEIDHLTQNKVFIKNLYSDPINIKLAHTLTVPTRF